MIVIYIYIYIYIYTKLYITYEGILVAFNLQDLDIVQIEFCTPVTLLRSLLR